MKKIVFDGVKVRKVIKEAGYTQGKIARELGITSNQISRNIIDGLMWAYRFDQIAKLLNVTPENLLKGDYIPMDKTNVELFQANPGTITITIDQLKELLNRKDESKKDSNTNTGTG